MTFAMTIIFMIMVFWRPQEWLVPQLYGVPLLDGVVYISLLTFALEISEKRVRLPKQMPQFYLLTGLWVAAMISHVVHGYFGGFTLAMQEVFKYCLFTLLLISVMDRTSRIRTVAAVMVFMTCFMAVHAVMQQRTGYGFGGQRPLWIPPRLGNPAYTRSTFFGIFNDPNDLGQMLVAAMPLVYALPRRLRGFHWVWTTALVALLYAGYAATESRGAFVGLVAMISLVVASRIPPRWMPKLMLAGLAGALILCATKSDALLDASARERLEFWGYGNQAFKSNLLFGVGFDMYWLIAGGRPAHNAFVSCYTEIGLLGYWMWFNLIQVGAIGAWRVRMALYRPDNEREAYLYRFAGLTLASLGGFSASAYFLSRTFIFPFFFLMALASAVAFVAGREVWPEGRPAPIQPKRDVVTRGSVGVVLSVVYIYVSILVLNKVAHG
jgi:putative inorganic carbon (hco3(-)) transporter